jgi:hypothetical protein
MLGQDMTISTAVVGPMIWGEEAKKVVYISGLLLKQVFFLHSKRSFSMYYFTIFIHVLCTFCVVSLGLYIPPHIHVCVGPRNI